MVERYSLAISSEEALNRFNVDVTGGYQPIYNGAPTHILPVITNENPRGFSFFFWGLPPEMTKNKPITKKLINARADQLMSRAYYKNALQNRRCLIPADSFFLWKKVSKKGQVPYRFIFNNERVFWIAGLWEEFEVEDSTKAHTFSMITMPSTQQIIPFSEDMPAIMKEKNIEDWLGNSSRLEKFVELINDHEEPDMRSYPVSSRINNINKNSPELIRPSKPMDQFGNYSLFD